MKRIIEIEKDYYEIIKYNVDHGQKYKPFEIIANSKPYDALRPRGEWIKQYGKSYELKTNEGILIGEFTKCPKCQYDKARGSNFCPNCGAMMLKGGEIN